MGLMHVQTSNATQRKKETGKMSMVSKGIGLRSYVYVDGKKIILDHTELQFSERYHGISFSFTCMDECGCGRMKVIDYLIHPLRWLTIPCDVPDDVEDMMFHAAATWADILSDTFIATVRKQTPLPVGTVLYGPEAIKYDKPGVVLCNVNHRRILPGGHHSRWCTEGVAKLLQMYRLYAKLIEGPADKQIPSSLYLLLSNYSLLKNGYIPIK